jgi:hypothetical protein
MASQETVSKGLKKAGGLSLMVAAVLFILSLPLTASLFSVLAPSSPVMGLQALQTQSLNYGTFVGTLIAVDLFVIVGLAALYFVLRNTSQFGALAAILFGLIGFGVDLATDLPLRYVQLAISREYATSTSDVQRSGIVAAYQFAFDYGNITALIVFFMTGLSLLFVGYVMLKDRSLFGRPTSYLALLGGVLSVIQVPLFAYPTAFGVAFFVGSVVVAAFLVLAGRRLYRM